MLVWEVMVLTRVEYARSSTTSQGQIIPLMGRSGMSRSEQSLVTAFSNSGQRGIP